MLLRNRLFHLVLLVVLLIAALPVTAQPPGEPYIAIQDSVLRYFATDGSVTDLQNVDNGIVIHIEFSPDGTRYAYNFLDYENGASSLFAGELGAAPVLLAEATSYMPFSFSPDGASIYFTVEPEPGSIDMSQTYSMTILRVPVDASASGEVIGQLPFGVGCGGGSPFPMDAVYSREAGYMGYALTFEMTAYGLLHSLDCSGRGVALRDIAADTELFRSESLARVKVSPDGQRAAGVMIETSGDTVNTSIALIDLAERTVNTVTTLPDLDQLAWGAHSDLFVSTRTALSDPLPLPENAAAAVNDLFGGSMSIAQYSVRVYRVMLEQDTPPLELYNSGAWSASTFNLDGDILYFSVVPTGETWAVALAEGQFEGGSPFSAEFNTVLPTVYRYDITTAALTEFAAGLAQMTVR